MEILELIWDFLNPNHPNVDMALAPVVGAALISGGVQLLGGLFGSRRAKKERRAAQRRIKQLEAQANALKNARPEVMDPYQNVTDVSGLAKDLSGMVTNPFANLVVATKATDIQIEQTDIALANTLDTLRATGSSAGGATALAQAALQSKQNVAANLEQQEAQNEKLRAQGEAQSQARIMAEKARIQGIEISEAQRVQQADAAGKQFVFQAEDNRATQDLNHFYSQMQGQQQNVANANAAQGQVMSGMMQGLASIGGSLLTSGAFGGGSGGGSSTQFTDMVNTADLQQPVYTPTTSFKFP